MLKAPETYTKKWREVSMLPPSLSKEEDIHTTQRRERFHLLKQLTRFGLVGGLNTLIDILVLNVLLLFWPTSSTFQILIYNALAYSAGAGNSFVCNKYWTFQQRQRVSRHELVRFAAATLLGMLLNSGLLWLIGLTLRSLQFNATLWTNASKILAIAATMLVSYLGMRLWVFASKAQHEHRCVPAERSMPNSTDIAKRATLPLHYAPHISLAPSTTGTFFVSQNLHGHIRFPSSVHMHASAEGDEHIITLSERRGSTTQDSAHAHGTDWSACHSLSVVLPAYNEEEIIASTVVTVLDVLSSWHIETEILVVNDGSFDRTGEIVATLARLHPQVRLINHARNQGYGAALVSGFQAATKELTFFMDSDGQFDIRALRSFFPFIETYDAVLGYRIERQDSWMRKFNAWGWKILVRIMLGVRARDLDCAFKLFHTSFLHDHPLETRGAMINAELLYRLKQGSFSQREVGVPHLPRMGGRATGAHPRVIARALRDLFVCARRWKRADKVLTRQTNHAK